MRRPYHAGEKRKRDGLVLGDFSGQGFRGQAAGASENKLSAGRRILPWLSCFCIHGSHRAAFGGAVFRERGGSKKFARELTKGCQSTESSRRGERSHQIITQRFKLMKTKFAIFLFLVGFLTATRPAYAQADTNEMQQLITLARHLKYQQGEIDLRDGLAILSVPKDFRFLDADDAETVLVKLWRNPPSQKKPLGMLIPAGMTPFSTNCWVVTISYDEDGYVKDDDASKINYDDLLKQMQKAVEENNRVREEKGYPAVHLIGWAEPPRYDATTHKMYWARQIKFDGEDGDTLNYSIRMLGRRGVLELNAIANVDQLPEIDAQTPQILGMVDFKEGNRYADFDPKVDKVAKYGLAALVTGGVLAAAAKLGFLKVLWLGILAAKKLIVLGVVAVVAYFKKLFKRKNNSSGGTPMN
jgi:uncharacterized membrane-anchored protein